MRDSETSTRLVPELAVYDRYAAAAQSREPALCCPVDYSSEYLRAIPQEIIDRDYGCGDPTPYVVPGDTVLDLGSGGGKLCYIIAQAVGQSGRVIGVDCNDEMLTLARKYQSVVAERIGFSNVEFRRGLIQDLQLDVDQLAEYLAEQPVQSPADWLKLRQREEQLRREAPLIADESVDCVVSNCVLNLVRQQDRAQLFQEIFRVLKVHGRAAISDIVSDQDVPEHLQQDPTLWSGCLSGAFREDQFMEAFAEAGFHGMQLVKRQAEPWQVVEGIEFRSVTVVAYKGPLDPGAPTDLAVIYRGPFYQVQADNGEVFVRGQRTPVSQAVWEQLQRSPYAAHFEGLAANAPNEANALLTIQPNNSCCGGGGTSCC